MVGQAGTGAPGRVFDPIQDAREYTWRETPRVASLPQTAPKYDEMTKPVRVPVPAMCIQKGQPGKTEVSCRCFTQQATPIDVPFNMCLEFARNGYFQEFDPDKDREATVRTETAVATLAGRPDAPLPDRDAGRSGPVVVALADVAERPVTPVRVTGATVLAK